MPRHRIYTIIGLAVLLAVVLSWAFRPRPISVDIVYAEIRPLTVSIREQARTRLQDSFEITAPVAAYAPRLNWEVGDRISAGQVLVTLDPMPASVLDPRSRELAEAEVARSAAALRAAEAALESARAAAELAASEYRRMQSLSEGETISARELDRARSDHAQAAAGLKSAKFNVEAARQSLRRARAALVQGSGNDTGNGSGETRLTITAPVAGKVLEVHHESAGIVQPGQLLMEIGDPRSLEIIAEVLTRDAVRLEPGLAVELDRWGGDRLLFGVVRCIEPSGFTKVSALGVEEQRTRVVIDLTSPADHWSRLGDGFRLDARFILWRDAAVLTVPNGALFRHNDGDAVFAVIDGRARIRPVRTGRRGELHTMILDGLDAGQAVIAHPDNEVDDGARVAPFRPFG